MQTETIGGVSWRRSARHGVVSGVECPVCHCPATRAVLHQSMRWRQSSFTDHRTATRW